MARGNRVRVGLRGSDSRLALSAIPCTVSICPMKTIRLVLTLAVASFIAAAVQAEDQKADAPAPKQAKCCVKAEAKGEKCTHDCCVEAAKDGNNCEKCGGSGKIEPKK